MWRSDKTKNAVLTLFNASASELIVFDVETTGFKADCNRVIQFSGIKFSVFDGKMVEKDRISTYINPEFALPEKITEITGITDEMLVDAPKEKEIFPRIKLFLGDDPTVCGHNVGFDIRFMKAMYSRYGCAFEPSVVLDTLEMARDLASDNAFENNRLGTLAKHYGVDYGLTFHNALDDVLACSRLLKIFYEEYMEGEQKKTTLCDAPTKQKVIVKYLRYWAGYRGHSRIYIFTNCGDFFYDIFNKVWGKGPNNVFELDMIDMESLRADALKLANAADEREFARFRG